MGSVVQVLYNTYIKDAAISFFMTPFVRPGIDHARGMFEGEGEKVLDQVLYFFFSLSCFPSLCFFRPSPWAVHALICDEMQIRSYEAKSRVK